MTQNRIEGKFYPLTPETAKKLREARLTAAEWRIWSYLVELDPFGDRYQELPDILTIMQECDTKKSTFYSALGKLQALELFDFQNKGIFARNLGIPKNRKTVQKIGKLSEKSETSPKIRKAFQEIGNQSENLDSDIYIDRARAKTPQTLQTHQTNQTRVAGENFFWEEDPWDDQEEAVGQAEGSQEEKPEVRQQEVKTEKEGLKQEKSQEQKLPVKKRISRAESSQNVTIPPDLMNKLEELSIPLDDKVRKAIASHDISQAYGAAAHVEQTWETINNPRSVFLYQLPKKPIEKKKRGFSTEFLAWYEQAIAQGIVEDVPPEYLPLDYLNEPKVRLPKPDPYIHAPYTLVEWRKLQADPDYDPNRDLVSPEQVSKFFEQFRQQLVRKGK